MASIGEIMTDLISSVSVALKELVRERLNRKKS